MSPMVYGCLEVPIILVQGQIVWQVNHGIYLELCYCPAIIMGEGRLARKWLQVVSRGGTHEFGHKIMAYSSVRKVMEKGQ